MTRKLYYDDVSIRRFEAKVEAFEHRDGHWHIRLDRTAFYPEGGGQPSDNGTIGDGTVDSVYEKNGDIWHVVSKPSAVGTYVDCAINWGRRFHYMQQHLGQHIISAVFHKHFGVSTVSVHFGVETSTIDIDRPMDAAQISDAELKANDVIFRNIAVETSFPDEGSIDENLRRKAENVSGPLRIVKIAGVDSTACCGTHCSSTGEVGMIKFYKSESYKGGMRISFACGGAAFIKYRQIYDNLSRVQKLLSVADNEVGERVQKLLDDVAYIRKERQSLVDRLLENEAEKMISASVPVGRFRLICEMMFDTTSDDMKGLFNHLIQRPGVVVVLGGAVPDGAMLLFGTYRGERRVDVRDIFRQSLECIDGKGGGSAISCQGVGADTSKLKEVVNAAGTVMEEMLSRISTELNDSEEIANKA